MTPITTSTAEATPVVVLFYKYFIPCPSHLDRYPVHYVEEFCRHQRELCARLQLKGRVVLANEGINGAMSARREQVLQEYSTLVRFMNLFQLPPSRYRFLNPYFLRS
jgi:predicted sulfurtransferase